MTVTSLSERPSSECEVRISLSNDITRDMEEPGVAGVYLADGTYYMGRPVFRQEGGVFTLSVTLTVWGGCWVVSSGVWGAVHLWSRTAPSMCAADPRAARHERPDYTTQKHWTYLNKQRGWVESGDISVSKI